MRPKRVVDIFKQYSIFDMIERQRVYVNNAGDPLPWENEENDTERCTLIQKKHPRNSLYYKTNDF